MSSVSMKGSLKEGYLVKKVSEYMTVSGGFHPGVSCCCWAQGRVSIFMFLS